MGSLLSSIKGTAADLGGAEGPEPKRPISRRFREGEGLPVLWLPRLAPRRLAESAGAAPPCPSGRARPGGQVTACPWGSAAGPPAARGSLCPHSPGWRCSPEGRSAAPGGGRHECGAPGSRPPRPRAEQAAPPSQGPPPRVHQESESFLQPHGAPQTQAEPAELRKGAQGGSQ